jgi:cytosine/adenosine deaminase-related metal-dependent hydrolase
MRDARLTFDTRFREVVRQSPQERAQTESIAIVPGLTNFHTHLELSGIDRPIGVPGMRFPEWIGEVVAWRRGQWGTPAEIARARWAAIERGLRESTAAGVMRVCDITSPGSQPLWHHGPVRVDAYQEVLGLSTAREDELFAQAKEAMASPARPWGISPHAPYTVGVELLARLAKLGVPLAMHLAESPEELELLRSHSGAFHTLLCELGAWDAAAIPRGITIIDYLKLLAAAPRALVIHGNYLSDDEIDFLAAHRETMTLVYCPRTHAYFGHSRYPLAEMLVKGVNVRVGTDSRASNPDLNLWNELRFVADAYPELPLATILSLAFDDEVGFQAGQAADFVVVEIPDEDGVDPHELLLDARSRVKEVWRGGGCVDAGQVD